MSTSYPLRLWEKTELYAARWPQSHQNFEMKLLGTKDIVLRHILAKWKDASIFSMTTRGRIIFGFQVGLIGVSDSSFERHWVVQFEILVEILETTVISRHKVQFSLIDVMDKKLTFKFFTKKIVRIDFHFILGIVAGHHGSSNKIIRFKIPFTIQNSPSSLIFFHLWERNFWVSWRHFHFSS